MPAEAKKSQEKNTSSCSFSEHKIYVELQKKCSSINFIMYLPFSILFTSRSRWSFHNIFKYQWLINIVTNGFIFLPYLFITIYWNFFKIFQFFTSITLNQNICFALPIFFIVPFTHAKLIITIIICNKICLIADHWYQD